MRKITLKNSKTIKTLQKTLQILENRDYEKAKTNAFFKELTKDHEEPDNTPELNIAIKDSIQSGQANVGVIDTIDSSDLNIEMLEKFSKEVVENTVNIKNHTNTIRIIDGNNNLVVFKGVIKQPYRSANDIRCKLLVNHKEYPESKVTYQRIIDFMKGTCVILNN